MDVSAHILVIAQASSALLTAPSAGYGVILDFVKDFQTLIAAAIALGAAALAYSSVRNQVRAAETRQHRQIEADRKRDEMLHSTERTCLASEIYADLQGIEHSINILQDTIERTLQGMKEGKAIWSKQLSTFSPPTSVIYRANAGRIGTLGKEIAARLIRAHHIIELLRSEIELRPIQADAVGKVTQEAVEQISYGQKVALLEIAACCDLLAKEFPHLAKPPEK